jgi:hypothetical protein
MPPLTVTMSGDSWLQALSRDWIVVCSPTLTIRSAEI